MQLGTQAVLGGCCHFAQLRFSGEAEHVLMGLGDPGAGQKSLLSLLLGKGRAELPVKLSKGGSQANRAGHKVRGSRPGL